MISAITALITALYRGRELANKEVWKNTQVAASILGGMLFAIAAAAKAYGYDLGLPEDQYVNLAGTVLSFGNAIVTAATSKSVGLPSKE